MRYHGFTYTRIIYYIGLSSSFIDIPQQGTHSNKIIEKNQKSSETCGGLVYNRMK